MTHVTCRLTAKSRDQLWNPTLGNPVWQYGLAFLPVLRDRFADNTDIKVSNAAEDIHKWKSLAAEMKSYFSH